MYREWSVCRENRENVYCVVITKMCRERKESDREREREREIGRVCVDCREIERVFICRDLEGESVCVCIEIERGVCRNIERGGVYVERKRECM